MHEQGDAEPVEKTVRFSGSAVAAGRLGVLLYTLPKNGTVYEVKCFRPGKPADMNILVQEALSA